MEYSNTVEGARKGSAAARQSLLPRRESQSEASSKKSAKALKWAAKQKGEESKDRTRKDHTGPARPSLTVARRGVKAFGAWCSLPRIVLQTLLHKEPRPKSESFKAKKMSLATPLRVAAEAHCHKVPLADYGDMPHIFRMEDAQVSRSLVLNRKHASGEAH